MYYNNINVMFTIHSLAFIPFLGETSYLDPSTDTIGSSDLNQLADLSLKRTLELGRLVSLIPSLKPETSWGNTWRMNPCLASGGAGRWNIFRQFSLKSFNFVVI